MFCKYIVRTILFSLIISFGFFVIIPNLCYAQYPSSLFGGYTSYQYEMYPGVYSLFSTYIDLGGEMIPYSVIKGSGIIFISLPVPEMTSGKDMMNPFFMIGRFAPLYCNLGGFEIMDEPMAFGRLNPDRIKNVAESVSIDKLNVLTGSLAGLVSLGSNAGLIYSGVTGLYTSVDF